MHTKVYTLAIDGVNSDALKFVISLSSRRILHNINEITKSSWSLSRVILQMMWRSLECFRTSIYDLSNIRICLRQYEIRSNRFFHRNFTVQWPPQKNTSKHRLGFHFVFHLPHSDPTSDEQSGWQLFISRIVFKVVFRRMMDAAEITHASIKSMDKFAGVTQE